MIVKLTTDMQKSILVNAYIHSDLGTADSLASYLENLHLLECMLDDIDYQSFVILGDFNADSHSGRAWNNLKDFINRNSIRCLDHEKLELNSYTHINYSTGHTKWLDHILGRTVPCIDILSVEIKSDMVGSDYLPMIMEFSVNSKNYGKSFPIKEVITEQQYVSWNSLNETELKNISEQALTIQSNYFNNHRHRCNKIGCSNIECLIFI